MVKVGLTVREVVRGLLKGSAFAAVLALATVSPDAVRSQEFDAGWQAYQAGDYATAIDIWQPLAEAGDPRAQYNLGSLYYDGRGVPQDRDLAIKWWGEAAGQGVIEAQHNLGLVFLSGDGAPKDLEKALGSDKALAQAAGIVA